MRIRSNTTTLVLTAVLALIVAAPAAADHGPQPFDVGATITSCGGDGLTIATEIRPATDDRNRRAAERAVRQLRRATLRLRFHAAPLYGRVRRAREIDLGRATSARRFVRFGDLPAQTYAGVVHYRWVRGSRTLLSGKAKTQRLRVSGRRGRAFCSLEVGKPPRDTQPPLIAPIPGDGAWRRGPLNVYFWAVDDLSGVALVVSRVGNGPYSRGRRLQIATEGVHRVAYVARDAAGNQSRPAVVTLRVDMNPPTAPTVTSPSGSTTDPTPEITWTQSTDTGSGVQGYFVLVRNAAGAIVWSQGIRGATAVRATVGQELAPGSYTSEVIAIDGAGSNPFTTKATSSFSVVSAPATPPAPPPPPPDTDGDGKIDAEDNCPSVANADQTDTDGDGQGDACDTDDDGDTVADGSDNCALTANQDQANFDGDTQGDACDGDDDNDGLADASDPNDADTDSDDDMILDGNDACPSQPRGVFDPNNDGCPS